mgnify:CR=1 FL=1
MPSFGVVSQVLCRQLGFSSRLYAYHCANYGQGSGRIWLDIHRCQRVRSHRYLLAVTTAGGDTTKIKEKMQV